MDKEEEELIQEPLSGQKVIDHSFDDWAELMLWLGEFTRIRFNVGNIVFYCHIDHMQILTRDEDKNTSYTIVIVYHQTSLVKQRR